MSEPHCQKKKFCLLMGIYLVLIMLDGLLTYIHTPDLAMEGLSHK